MRPEIVSKMGISLRTPSHLESVHQGKSTFASLLHLAGITQWKLRQYTRKDVAVLMYHRIIPMKDVTSAVQAGMVVEPDTLDLHIKYFAKTLRHCSHLRSDIRQPSGRA